MRFLFKLINCTMYVDPSRHSEELVDTYLQPDAGTNIGKAWNEFVRLPQSKSGNLEIGKKLTCCQLHLPIARLTSKLRLIIFNSCRASRIHLGAVYLRHVNYTVIYSKRYVSVYLWSLSTTGNASIDSIYDELINCSIGTHSILKH